MSLALNIRAFTRCGPSPVEGIDDNNALGIELEFEQFRQTERWESDYWVASPDGSLRNFGVELVSRPLTFDDVESALSDAETIIQGTGAIATERCGLHTHMNMRPYSIGQVWSLGSLYAIIEPTLYQTFALNRENSMFAVPMWMNTQQVSALSRDMNAIRQSSNDSLPGCHSIGTSKYSALNFASLATFGTLEMRQPYCSTDFEAIRSWTDFCQRLVEIGTSFEDPYEVLDYYERSSLEEVQERMFGITVPIDPELQELADDAAYYITGEIEPQWEELEWRVA